MASARSILIWTGFVLAVALPIGVAIQSPLLAYRDPIYIAAGLAGVLGMALLMTQPVLANGLLPGLRGSRGRRLHRWIGAALGLAIAVHVAGLWLTSPPDMVDALLFASPTPFSPWGVIAMWTMLAAGLLSALRARLTLYPRTWRRWHSGFATITVLGSAVHAMLVVGTMGAVSKTVLCALAVAATVKALVDLRIRRNPTRARQ
ncbi:ferric reductase-like transmembrane domain-containing protein (plasmid) [Marinovum sp. KMM 9989]